MSKPNYAKFIHEQKQSFCDGCEATVETTQLWIISGFDYQLCGSCISDMQHHCE